jgi:aspartate racemase
VKTIGILGGMSPESTVEYYQRMIHEYTRRYGDHGYPPIITYSVSFQRYIDWLGAGRWDRIAAGLIDAGERLADAGADVLVIATNTMHKVATEVDKGTRLPLLSLLDVVAAAITDRGMAKVGLLGTRFTMEEDFYPVALGAHGISVVTPAPADRALVDGVVWDELVEGVIRDESRAEYVRIIGEMVEAGAEGVILGCTEIPLLVGEDDAGIPLFDTTQLHADAALAYALGEPVTDG